MEKKTLLGIIKEHKTEIIAGVSFITSCVCGYNVYKNSKNIKALAKVDEVIAESVHDIAELNAILMTILVDSGKLTEAYLSIPDGEEKKELLTTLMTVQAKFEQRTK